MAEDPRSQLRATAHPIRLQMLSLLTGAELSAADVARELDLTHANASYHLRVLLDAGQLEVAGEEKIRGGVARRYRHRPAPADDRPKRRKPTAQQRASAASRRREHAHFVRVIAEQMVARSAQAAIAPALFTDAELWVSAETEERVDALLRRASALLHEAAQPPRTEGTRRHNLTIGWFEMESTQ